MPQLILSNSERIAPAAVVVDDHKPVGTDVDFPDVLADLDVDVKELPDYVVEYGRVRVGETEESRTRLVAELEDMIYGEHLPLQSFRSIQQAANFVDVICRVEIRK